jgi:hypothetical protein
MTSIGRMGAMGTGADALAVEFQRHRTHLLGVAYRLTGWLTTVVSRC